MLIFGTRSHEIHTESLHVKCPYCNAPASLKASVHQYYFHLFFIPTFPLGKTGGLYCASCGAGVNEERLIEPYKTYFNQAASGVRTTWWSFLGAALVVILITSAVVSILVSSKNTKEYVLYPQANDIYELKRDNYSYTLMKVQYVTPDSIFVKMSQYETNSSAGLYSIVSKSMYPDIYGFSRKEIYQMYKRREIPEVHRGSW